MAIVEAGIRNTSAYFVREASQGVVPTNPDWLRFSDSIKSLTATPQANIFQRRNIGSPNVQGFHGGSEDHSFGIQYYPQRFLVDGSGAALDAAGDVLLRDADNDLAASHALFVVQDFAAGGALSAGRRIYTVGLGGKVATVTLSGEPESGEPIVTDMQYQFEKLRSYVIDQLDADVAVTVESTSTADTTQTVTVEDRGVANSASLALNGTTPVSSGATTFADIEGFFLSAETEGDVILKKSGGAEIARIYGRNSYQDREGDLGVPALGSGSYESALGSAYTLFVGSTVKWPSGTDLADTVMQLSFTVNNNLEAKPRIDSLRRRIYAGDVSIEVGATIFGEKDTHDKFIKHLQVTEQNLIWTLSNGVITAVGAVCTDPGSREYATSRATMDRGATFTGKSITAVAS